MIAFGGCSQSLRNYVSMKWLKVAVPLEGNNFNGKTFGLSNEVSLPYLSIKLRESNATTFSFFFFFINKHSPKPYTCEFMGPVSNQCLFSNSYIYDLYNMLMFFFEGYMVLDPMYHFLIMLINCPWLIVPFVHAR